MAESETDSRRLSEMSGRLPVLKFDDIFVIFLTVESLLKYCFIEILTS